MIGAVIFVALFVLFTLVSLVVPSLPPGAMIYDWLGMQVPEYSKYIIGIANGVVYGFIFWLIYSLANLASKRGKAKPAPVPAPVTAPALELEEAEEFPLFPQPPQLDQGVEVIEGITLSYAGKLKDSGIKTINDLLKAGSTRKGRREIARKTGASTKTVLRWVNRADLFRVRGIGKEYSNLLEKSGVNTIVELSRRNPTNLHKKLKETNITRRLVRQIPSSETVEDWVQQAKNLDRIVEY